MEVEGTVGRGHLNFTTTNNHGPVALELTTKRHRLDELAFVDKPHQSPQAAGPCTAEPD